MNDHAAELGFEVPLKNKYHQYKIFLFVIDCDFHKIDHIFSNLLHRLAPHHKRMGFTEEELVNLYVKAGLVILRIKIEKGIITLVGIRP